MIKEFIRLQTPVTNPPTKDQPCQIIMLSIGDNQADAEMVKLIKQCGGIKK